MPNALKHFQRLRTSSPLSLKLMAWILLFSSVFTVIASGIQLYSDYRKDVSLIDQRLKVIESGYASSLAGSLWALDQKLLQTQMEGILSLPDIAHLRLRIEPDSELVMGSVPRGAETKTHSFTLVHDGDRSFTLGELTITASLDRVYREMKQKIGVILATQFLKIFFVSILILWIFRHLVTRHLSDMAAYARYFSLANLSQPLTLDRPDSRANRKDELGQVVDAINQMRERLNTDVARQNRDAAEIRKFSKAIEQSPSSVLICDRQWRIEYVNQKFSQLTGFDRNSIVGKHPSELGGEGTRNRERQHLWQSIRLQVQRVDVWQGEVNSVRKNGERFWEQLVVTPIKDNGGGVTGYLILGEDVSIRKRYEQQLLRQANYDILTGLPNRMLALDRLKLALAQARRENTERLLLDNSIETAAILYQLDQAGVRLSVDDFGTGYSALSYLKSYPFDVLKIDKSFVNDIIKEPEDASLVRAIINMAHSLGLKVVAEGVEEEGQATILRQEHCDYSQGYFYSRAQPAREFEAWLQEHHRIPV